MTPEEVKTGEETADETATEDTPVNEVATDEAAVEETVEEIVTEDTPVNEVVTEEAVVNEVATDEAAAEKTVDEIVTEEVATEETAVDEVTGEVAVGEDVIDNAGTDEVIIDRVVAVEAPVEVDSQARDYELVLVISPEVAEERFEAIIDNVSQYVTGKEGTITSIDRWGKRNLAYPIKHQVDGSYVLARFKMKPAFGKELENSLRISTEVLRHLLIKLDN